MFRFALGQLVLVALTAIVGAQSIGFLEPEGSSNFRNVFPVVAVLQQDAAEALTTTAAPTTTAGPTTIAGPTTTAAALQPAEALTTTAAPTTVNHEIACWNEEYTAEKCCGLNPIMQNCFDAVYTEELCCRTGPTTIAGPKAVYDQLSVPKGLDASPAATVPAATVAKAVAPTTTAGPTTIAGPTATAAPPDPKVPMAPDSVVPQGLDASPAATVPAATVAKAVAKDPPTAAELKKLKLEADAQKANIERVAIEMEYEQRLFVAHSEMEALKKAEKVQSDIYELEKLKAYPAYRHKMAVKAEAARMKAMMHALNVKEDAALQKAWKKMVARHKVERSRQKLALDRYDKVMTAKYACTTVRVRDKMKLQIRSKRRTERATMYIKNSQEKKIFITRMKCLQQTPGDQSWQSVPEPKVAACIKAGALLEKAPVAQYQGISLNEKAAVKKQVDRFKQMQEHAMHSAVGSICDSPVCEGLFNTKQKHEQMEDTWDEDHKEDLQQCTLSTGTEKKVVDAEENHATAVDVKQKVVKTSSARVSEFKDALAHAKKVVAEASEALAKEPDA